MNIRMVANDTNPGNNGEEQVQLQAEAEAEEDVSVHGGDDTACFWGSIVGIVATRTHSLYYFSADNDKEEQEKAESASTKANSADLEKAEAETNSSTLGSLPYAFQLLARTILNEPSPPTLSIQKELEDEKTTYASATSSSSSVVLPIDKLARMERVTDQGIPSNDSVAFSEGENHQAHHRVNFLIPDAKTGQEKEAGWEARCSHRSVANGSWAVSHDGPTTPTATRTSLPGAYDSNIGHPTITLDDGDKDIFPDVEVGKHDRVDVPKRQLQQLQQPSSSKADVIDVTLVDPIVAHAVPEYKLNAGEKQPRVMRYLFWLLISLALVLVAVSYTHLTLPTNREV